MSAREPMDDGQRRLAERRLLSTLRRLHRREPLKPDIRVDTLVAELRASDRQRPAGHRGATRLTLDDAALRFVVDSLVASGALRRDGHRVRLPGGAPAFDPIMRRRVDELMETLARAGATPPAAEGLAARLGIPGSLLDQLRASGELVAVVPRIDYPRESWAEISALLDRLAAAGLLSVRAVRDELGTTRRHAQAILHRHLGEVAQR